MTYSYSMIVPGWYVKIHCMRHRDIFWPQIYSANCLGKLHINTSIATKQQNKHYNCVCLSKKVGALGVRQRSARNCIYLNCKERTSVQSKITPNIRFKFFSYFSCLLLPNSFFYVFPSVFLTFPNLIRSPNSLLLMQLYISIFHSLSVALHLFYTCLFYQFGLSKKYGKINYWRDMLSCCSQVTQLCAALNQSRSVRRNLHVLPTQPVIPAAPRGSKTAVQACFLGTFSQICKFRRKFFWPKSKLQYNLTMFFHPFSRDLFQVFFTSHIIKN